ncbi:MAG: hypothetical protein WAK03_08175 [Methylocystis sp.]|jgi:hypothetical protein
MPRFPIIAVMLVAPAPAFAADDALPRCVSGVVSYMHHLQPRMSVEDMPEAIVSHCHREIAASQQAIGQAKTGEVVESSARAAFASATRNDRR